MTKKRNYRDEYKAYHGKPEQIKRRAQRNAARRTAEKKGLVKRGDSKEVHHVDAPRKGRLNNRKVKVVSKRENRRIQPKRS